MTRPLLAPLDLVYAMALKAKNARYDKTAPLKLQWPVVSVGNLSVGGSGKTPLVIRLAQLFQQEGWAPDVLSRGYGRSGSAAERVEAAGDARRFGDEPLMIARTVQAPVFVGGSRYEAGLLAEREESGGRPVHLLDDGFQHRQLARRVDIVVMHRDDLNDRLLPWGRLREPLSSLKRADAIVLREEDAALAARLSPYIRSGIPIWRVKRRLSLGPKPEAASDGRRKRAVAFCAIARPEEFFHALEAAGLEVAARVSFRDHHRYTRKDMEALRKLGERQGCEEFITTEKDAVKLDAQLRRGLTEVAPLRVARLLLEFVDEGAVMAQLVAMLGPARG